VRFAPNEKTLATHWVGRGKIMKWVLSFLLGCALWYILTIIFGFIIGFMGLGYLDHFKENSFFYNIFLYPIGIWLGFKITKTPFFPTKKKEE
tara:strand:- start:51 stop:326 length:276 start_codon:yes stop_codon:yes gene_type:complete